MEPSKLLKAQWAEGHGLGDADEAVSSLTVVPCTCTERLRLHTVMMISLGSNHYSFKTVLN